MSQTRFIKCQLKLLVKIAVVFQYRMGIIISRFIHCPKGSHDKKFIHRHQSRQNRQAGFSGHDPKGVSRNVHASECAPLECVQLYSVNSGITKNSKYCQIEDLISVMTNRQLLEARSTEIVRLLNRTKTHHPPITLSNKASHYSEKHVKFYLKYLS